MRQVPDGTQRSRPFLRPWHTRTGVPRWVRREVAGVRCAVRAAGRRTVVVETLVCALAGVFGLLPLLLAPPERPVWAVLEALWAALLVPARRVRPVAAVLGACPLVMGHNVWTLAVAPLVVLSATRRIAPPRRAWRVAGAGCAAVGVLTGAVALVRPEGLRSELAGNAVSAVLLIGLPTLAGTLLGRRRPLISLLRERNAYLEQARTLTAVAARMEERTRIAGEMHDLLGHRLSLISVHAGALELAAARQAPALADRAELLRTTAGTAMEELREVLGVLRREDLTDPMDRAGDERGTREDITALVRESRQTGATVELDWSVPETAEVGLRTRQAIHRVVREGLTNVLKHAPGAPTWVVVRGADGGIEVSVTNQAPPAGTPPGGGSRSGLAGCQERILLLGGTFRAGAAPDGGFRMAAWFPAHGKHGNRADHGNDADHENHVDHRNHADHGNGPPESVALPGGFAGTPPEGARLRPGGIGRRGARPPLPDEILTWPRVLGSGCLALLVVLPTAVFLIVLLADALLR
ncbi:sensor histidine kinase [Streptomyces hygroscopicus]|uniref:sensor histidine kinase n=1 Tax=Streptomyces hygroscopicus TaxID=1912 RepID=UPI003676665C